MYQSFLLPQRKPTCWIQIMRWKSDHPQLNTCYQRRSQCDWWSILLRSDSNNLNVIGMGAFDLLTIDIQSGSTCDRSCRVWGNTWVHSFMVGENSGNLHLAGFTIMRHPEDVWLLDLSVITEPRNLQIWRHNVHLHSGSSQPQCFIMELLQNTWIYTKQVLGLKTWTVKYNFCNQQPDGGQGGLPSPEMLHWNWAGCPSVTRTSRMGAMRTGAETRATVSTTSGTGRQSRRQKT